MAITFFGVASSPADNTGQTGASLTITPPASMQDGDLVLVSVRRRASTGTITNTVTGGQSWTAEDQYDTTNIRARLFWCRFNGTWAADPEFTLGGTNAIDGQMLVFRPTSTAHTWSLDAAPATNTYTAPTTPFTVTVTGRTTVAASTVTLAAWHSVDNNTWGTLSGSGWSKTSLGAQYRNTNNSSTYAYNIRTSQGTIADVSQNQATLGGDAGSILLVTFAEIQTTVALTGNAATAPAGSLAISHQYLGLAGQESVTAVGAIIVDTPAGGNATATPSGVSASGAAGTLGVVLSPVVGPIGAGVGAAVGGLVESITASSAIGASSVAQVGSLAALGSAPGLVVVGGVSATPQAGSLSTSIATAGLDGQVATATIGTLTAVAGGIVNAAGQPSTVFATGQAGGIAVNPLSFLPGVFATLTAEEISAGALITEIDGVQGALSAGDMTPLISVPMLAVQSVALAGTPVPSATAAHQPSGAQAVATVGNLAGITSGFASAIPGGVEAAGATGTLEPSWTFDLTPTGVEASAVVGTVAIEAGDSEAVEVFPSGVAATIQLGILSTGEARAAPDGVQSSARAGAFSVAVVIPYPLDRPDSISVVPMFEATVSVEPHFTADLVKVIPVT